MTIKKPLTREEAESLTERIKLTTQNLWELIYEAHEGEAWLAMDKDYKTWNDYVAGEFDFGKQYSFRLLDQAKITLALQEAASESPRGDSVNITEFDARRLKPNLAEAVERIKEGEKPMEVVKDMTANQKVKKAMAERAYKIARDAGHSPSPYSQTNTTRTLGCLKCVQHMVIDFHTETISGLQDDCRPVDFDRQSRNMPVKTSPETLRRLAVGESRGFLCGHTTEDCPITSMIRVLNRQDSGRETLIRYYQKHFGRYVYVTKIELLEGENDND